MITLDLTQGYQTVIDEDDWKIVSRFKWFAAVSPHNGLPYARCNATTRSGKRTSFRLHRLLLGNPKSLVDHKNGNTLDNRRDNLRAANVFQSAQNKGKRRKGSSRFKGVCWYPNYSKWTAQITGKGRRITLGYFVSEEDAARAYDRAAKELHGEFARPNFKD